MLDKICTIPEGKERLPSYRTVSEQAGYVSFGHPFERTFKKFRQTFIHLSEGHKPGHTAPRHYQYIVTFERTLVVVIRSPYPPFILVAVNGLFNGFFSYIRGE
jgi:hypothetical protein